MNTAEISWSPLTASHREDYARLLNRAFALEAPADYLSDFPVWDPSLPKQISRYQIGGWRGLDLVCTASLREVEYVLSAGSRAKIGMVGAVATIPEFHGKGLASAALEKVLAEGRARGVRAFTLWGAQSTLYARLGFEFGGVQLRTGLEQVTIDGSPLEGFEIRSGWDLAIAEFFLRRMSGVQYRDSDLLWLARQTSVEWRSLWLDGQCLAYCAWNRGIDLPNMIHELDGTVEGMRSLLGFVKSRYPHLELLHHPRFASYGIRALAPAEVLAQFLFTEKNMLLEKQIDSLWFTGMDAC